MKIRIRDRLFVSLAGLLLAASGAALIAQAYFQVDIASRVLQFIGQRDLKHMAITIGAAVALVLLGVYCFLMLFRHKKRNSGLVTQKTETGDLSISIKALEGLVQKCIDKHDEMDITSMKLENSRDGLIVRMRAGMSDNMNIPLAVASLQKQIKTYVSECSGLDVKEVLVQVDTTAAKVKDSVYTVADGSEARKSEPEAPAAAAAEEPKRPVHQRLFGRKEQLNTVPVAPAAPEKAEEKPAEPVDAPVAETPVQPEPEQAQPVEEAAAEVKETEEAPATEEAADEVKEPAVPEVTEEKANTVAADKEVRLDDL